MDCGKKCIPNYCDKINIYKSCSFIPLPILPQNYPRPRCPKPPCCPPKPPCSCPPPCCPPKPPCSCPPPCCPPKPPCSCPPQRQQYQQQPYVPLHRYTQ